MDAKYWGAQWVQLFMKNSSVNSVQINKINNSSLNISVLHWFKSRLVTSVTGQMSIEMSELAELNGVSVMNTKYITRLILALSWMNPSRLICCVQWLMPCSLTDRELVTAAPDVKQHITSFAKNKTEAWNKPTVQNVMWPKSAKEVMFCVQEGYF